MSDLHNPQDDYADFGALFPKPQPWPWEVDSEETAERVGGAAPKVPPEVLAARDWLNAQMALNPALEQAMRWIISDIDVLDFEGEA